MDYISSGVREAIFMILRLDKEFIGIVWVSIRLSSTSILLASLAGCPLGVALLHGNFRGKQILLDIINTLMALPTVVVGLFLYALLSRRGPLGSWGLLYTLSGIVMGQFLLALPIVTGLTISAVHGLDDRVKSTALSLGANRWQSFSTLIRESRPAVLAAIMAGFGRVFAEVGVSMMIGGNIRGYTRTITTAIALETSKGEFALGIALGIVLLAVAFTVNVFLARFKRRIKRERL